METYYDGDRDNKVCHLQAQKIKKGCSVLELEKEAQSPDERVVPSTRTRSALKKIQIVLRGQDPYYPRREK